MHLAPFAALLLCATASAQTTILSSTPGNAVYTDGVSSAPSISHDGLLVAFVSSSTDMTLEESDTLEDVFVRNHDNGETRLVSVSTGGQKANARCFTPVLSGDGRYVAFTSNATNLVPGDTNGKADVFLRDRLLGTTERVSVSSAGGEGNGGSWTPDISADGRFVVFTSGADNLVAGDTNGREDVFLRDVLLGETTRISASWTGAGADHQSLWPRVSGDGSVVTFMSRATNLVPDDDEGFEDVFVHFVASGTTARLSVGAGGEGGNGNSVEPDISDDGTRIVFGSLASNLISGDTNDKMDVFVVDLVQAETTRVSVDSQGVEADDGCWPGSISPDGSAVTFFSQATNLVEGDPGKVTDVFLHRLGPATTVLVSKSSMGAFGDKESREAVVSGDARVVAFESRATNLVGTDPGLELDVFRRDLANGHGTNDIYLFGHSTIHTGESLDLHWSGAPPSGAFVLAVSLVAETTVITGHKFGLGAPIVVLASGLNTSWGGGSFTTPPVQPGFVGLTLHFELASADANGVLFDSNVVSVGVY